MALRSKTPKPLRFLSLFLAVGLAGMLCAMAAKASITESQEKCVAAFKQHFKTIDKIDLSKLEPENFCNSSVGAENDKAPEVDKRKKIKLSNGKQVDTSFEGACLSSIEALQEVLKNLLASRTQICQEMHSELSDKFPKCLSSEPADTCKDHIEEMADIYVAGKKRLVSDLDKSRSFLTDYANWNDEAKEKFKKDHEQLKTIRASGDRDKLEQTATPPDAPHQVDAIKQNSESLQAYLDKLDKKNIKLSKVSRAGAKAEATNPVQEQENAKNLVYGFIGKIDSLKSTESKNFDLSLAGFKEKLAKVDNSSLTDGAKKYLPAVAPLASPFMNNGTNPAPVSSIGTGGSGALPALALAGAAGLALGAGKKSSGGSSLGVEGPVMTPNNTAGPTTFDDVKTTNAGDDTAAPPPKLDGEKEDTDSEKADAGVLNSAAANGYGGGASSFPGGQQPKKDLARKPATPSTAGSDETLKPFGGELRPTPRPAAAPDSSGNEVSALLGKMKDLFNLDENFGMDMPPPDYMGSGGPVSPANGSTPSASADDGEYASEYNDEEYAAEEYAGDEGQVQGSNPLGNIDVTLFRRVHARHFKCMEKGLVLLMQPELTE